MSRRFKMGARICLLYDEIGCGLKIRQLQQTKQELLEALQMYYKVLYVGI